MIRRVVANGVEFPYLEAGPPDGPLALCLHGFPDHAPTFDDLLTDLGAAGFHAVAPWMRGYAPTAVPADGRYQTAALALDALALADALAADGPAFCVGHDWGAAAAHLAAAHRPERFARIVTLAVPHLAGMAGRFFTDPVQLKRSWYMFFFQHPLAESAVAANDFAFVDMLWRDWSPGYEPGEEFMKRLKETLGSPGTLEAALGYYRALWNPSLHDPALAEVQNAALSPITVPALYLHGTDDGCVGADVIDVDALRAAFPAGLELEMIQGTGHFLHLERPEAVNSRIVAFLRAG